jgi:hypothetical protein
MKKVLTILTIATIMVASSAAIAGGKAKSKFYDFSDQLIDGSIAKPHVMINDAKAKVKFERLLSLKKSFMPALLSTAKEKVFK